MQQQAKGRETAQRTTYLLAVVALWSLCALPCFGSRVVIDDTGRSVTVPDRPHRIVCLTPSITDSMFALGAGGDVAAVTDFVRYPIEATQKPSVGSPAMPSLEAIVALHPDLLLATPHFTQQSVVERFERLGFPVYMVDPHGVEGILRSLTHLGDATMRAPEAAALVSRLRRRIDAVRAHVRDQPAISVFMPLSYDPVFTIGKGAFITDIIEIAGGHSITSDMNQEWPQISLEAVIARAPQALVLVRDARVTPAILRTRPGWETLPALRNGRVYFFDQRIDLPSPAAIDALEDLARQLHP